MPEYLAPGVYVEEIPSGNMPIQAASTSTAGMVGCAARGPVGAPTLVTSMGAYSRLFGGRLDPDVFKNGLDALPYAVEGFFANGGARLYVVRVAGAGAKESTVDLRGDREVELAAEAPAASSVLKLVSITGLAPGSTLTLGGQDYQVIEVRAADTSVTIQPALSAELADELGGTASHAGTKAAAAGTAGDTQIEVAAGTGLQVDDILTIVGTDHAVTAVSGASITIDPALAAPLPADSAIQVRRPIQLAAAAPAGATQLTLTSVAGLTTGSTITVAGHSYQVTAVDGGAASVTVTPPVSTTIAAATRGSARTTVCTVHARWYGAWGDNLRVTVANAGTPLAETQLVADAAAGTSQLTLVAVAGLSKGSVIAVKAEYAVVQSVDAASRTVTLKAPLENAAPKGTPVASQEFSLKVELLAAGRAVESEFFDRLSLVKDHPRFVGGIVGSWTSASRWSESGGSTLVRVEGPDDATDPLIRMAEVFRAALGNGADDVAGINGKAITGNVSDNPAERTGIEALANEPTISIVAVPGQSDLTVQNHLVDHCEQLRYRFAVLDVPIGANLDNARKHRQNFDTTRAAIYYPALMIADSFGYPGDQRAIPSAGHMLGVYARTDIIRGVHKAPGNEVVRGILGFTTKLTKGEQDILNPINLNCFRDFREQNLGLRVYGARVATSNPQWRYINVRRLLLFIEQSLDTGLQWAVFEPNAEPLWATVKQAITGFLTTVWRNGALEGTKPEEAFFVKIGYEVTMWQDDIDNGRMIVEVGVAPVKPAEFVIVRITQKTREASA